MDSKSFGAYYCTIPIFKFIQSERAWRNQLDKNPLRGLKKVPHSLSSSGAGTVPFYV